MEILGKPITYPIDGRSFLSTLYHPDVSFNRGPVFWHYPHFSNQEGRPAGAVRLGEYKLIENYETGDVSLYNLKVDISEAHDLSKRLPEKRDELFALFTAWKKEVNANMPIPNPEFKGK
jgi:hypothetical protein